MLLAALPSPSGTHRCKPIFGGWTDLEELHVQCWWAWQFSLPQLGHLCMGHVCCTTQGLAGLKHKSPPPKLECSLIADSTSTLLRLGDRLSYSPGKPAI